MMQKLVRDTAKRETGLRELDLEVRGIYIGLAWGESQNNWWSHV